jgi:hypothetical protein
MRNLTIEVSFSLVWRWEEGDGEKCCKCGDACWMRQARCWLRIKIGLAPQPDIQSEFILCQSCAGDMKVEVEHE